MATSAVVEGRRIEAKDALRLPLIVNGRPVDDADDFYRVDLEEGPTLVTPVVTPDQIREIVAAGPALDAELRALDTYDVTSFLSDVGAHWLDGRSPALRLAIEHAHRFSGYPPATMSEDYHRIANVLRWRAALYDVISGDLGHELILDDWVPVHATYQRCFPLGLVLHYLVGNLPLASMYSLVRGLLTRNRSLAKLPTRDPLSAWALARSFGEVDPDHPLTRSLSVCYWPHGAEIESEVFDGVDGVCLWGGDEAMRSLKPRVPGGVRIVEYGPRHSLAVASVASDDYDTFAYRLVDDVCSYDQEACFSVQRLIVDHDPAPLMPALERHLSRYATLRPRVTPSRDLQAQRSAALIEARYHGHEVFDASDWAVVVVRDGPLPAQHPLSRVLFIHQLASLEQAVQFIDHRTQTVAAWPWTVGTRHATEWAGAGASRIVEVGMARHPRYGFTHDGRRALLELVRTVSLERGFRDHNKWGLRSLDVLERERYLTASEAP